MSIVSDFFGAREKFLSNFPGVERCEIYALYDCTEYFWSYEYNHHFDYDTDKFVDEAKYSIDHTYGYLTNGEFTLVLCYDNGDKFTMIMDNSKRINSNVED